MRRTAQTFSTYGTDVANRFAHFFYTKTKTRNCKTPFKRVYDSSIIPSTRARGSFRILHFLFIRKRDSTSSSSNVCDDGPLICKTAADVGSTAAAGAAAAEAAVAAGARTAPPGRRRTSALSRRRMATAAEADLAARRPAALDAHAEDCSTVASAWVAVEEADLRSPRSRRSSPAVEAAVAGPTGPRVCKSHCGLIYNTTRSGSAGVYNCVWLLVRSAKRWVRRRSVSNEHHLLGFGSRICFKLWETYFLLRHCVLFRRYLLLNLVNSACKT